MRGPCLAARDQTAGRWPESCSSSSEMTAMAKVTSATVTSVNESIREAIRELTAVREEGRLQRHQFSLQAMQRWNELETELDALEERIGQSGARTLDAVMARTRELTAKVRQFLRRQGASAKDRLATKVRLVMTPNVSTATPADGLNRAAQIMWEGDCGVVPVTESDGSLVGVITDRDVCMAAYTQGQPLAAVPIDAAMARTVFACSPDDTVHQALHLMREHRVRRMPVVDEAGRLVGVVTLADLARHVDSLGDDAACAHFVSTLAAISEPRRSDSLPPAAAAE